LRASPLFALLLVLAANDAGAAALGSLGAKTGLFAMLAALLLVQSWPSHLIGDALPALGGVIVVAAGAAMLWRMHRRALAVRVAVSMPIGRAAVPAPQGATLVSPLQPVALPQGVDRSRLLGDLRRHFVALQVAWDTGEVDALRGLTTAEMLCELVAQLPTRGPGSNHTDVLTLNADLIGFEELGVAHLASVEFSGMIRESPEHGAAPFRELWMLARSKDEADGWRLARQQALF
ncbi:MAG: Tim44-like domain-containing protein, partial [Burkholderiaceae bacterium]